MRSFLSPICFAAIFIIAPLLSRGQDAPMIAVVQKRHFAASPTSKFEEWRTAQKEYFDKVVAKNELIVAANLLVHYYTPDASEVLFYTLYRNWDDVDKASKRNNELVKSAWPDSVARKTAMQKLSDYFTSQHSDEILSTIPGLHSKQFDTSAHVFYLRTSHLSFPKDGSNAEIISGINAFTDNVGAKNDLLKGYYTFRHLYGADSREFTEVFAYKSLTDLDKATGINTDLIKKYWPDEKKREDAGAKVSRYFESWHADAIYTSVSGLVK